MHNIASTQPEASGSRGPRPLPPDTTSIPQDDEAYDPDQHNESESSADHDDQGEVYEMNSV